jgi:two-component system sensor histidine kinase DegS
MGDESSKPKIQSVFDRTNEFLDYSMDHVSGIRNDVMVGLRDIYDELNEVRNEINEVLTAGEAVSKAYRQAKKALVNAEMSQDHELQARMYEEAERYMRLRLTFEERERYLKRRRDDLEREKICLERIMSHSTNIMGKLRLAIEILKNKMDPAGLVNSAMAAQSVAIALRFVEREHKRLAREIHDGPVQQFAASILSFEYLEKLASYEDWSAVRIEIDRIKRQLQAALGEFRGFLLQLQPLGLENGLGWAIRRLAENYREMHGVDFQVHLSQEEDHFSSILRSNIFRIIQEAASNALRHGNAAKIEVSCEYEDGELLLSIEDDGDGFDVEKESASAAERGSFGLSNMSERVNFVKGKLKIYSDIGKGTEITIRVPIGGD